MELIPLKDIFKTQVQHRLMSKLLNEPSSCSNYILYREFFNLFNLLTEDVLPIIDLIRAGICTYIEEKYEV